MLTSNLTDIALDWAVAKCEGHPCSERSNNPFQFKWDTGGLPHYSSDWAQGGPIIERENISLDYAQPEDWAARSKTYQWAYGPTPLIAAMRCWVSSQLGSEVDVPKELLPANDGSSS